MEKREVEEKATREPPVAGARKFCPRHLPTMNRYLGRGRRR